MKKLLEKIIQQRNPAFQFDPLLAWQEIAFFLWLQCCALARGARFLLYGKRPRFMLAGKRVRFHFIRRIHWGSMLKLGDHVYMSALGKQGIVLGNHVSIGAFSRLVVATTFNALGKGIHIGNNVGIGEFAYLGGAGGLSIGDDCIIGQYLSCHPENHHYSHQNLPIRMQGVSRKGIVIGRNCWIGSKVTILDGVTIGDGCVIAAGSVVTKSFPANSLIGGVPAKLLRNRAGASAPENITL